MKTFHQSLITIHALLASASMLFAQGVLTPPGAPAPTMKTLDQIEARTPISSLPFTINSSGSYYLTKNMSVTTGDAITIGANGVTLDLNGFTISSTAPSATGTAILLATGLSDITILNGHIKSGVTYSGGSYSGTGFVNGINYSGAAPTDVLVTGVSVSGCLNYGIFLNSGGSSTVAVSCTVQTAGGYGISAATVKSSVAFDCGINAITGAQVSDCYGASHGFGSGYGIFGSEVHNCTGSAEGVGYGVFGYTVQNCFGYSSGTGSAATGGAAISGATVENCFALSTGGDALTCTSAYNCYGVSDGNGYGILATTAVQNCVGYSIGNSDGVNSKVVANCYGSSYGNGNGVSAQVVTNTYGSSLGSGYGIYADVATNCTGSSGAGGHGVTFIEIGAMCYGTITGAGFSYVLGNGAVGPVNLP